MTPRRSFIAADTFHHGDVVMAQASTSQIIVCPICGFDYNHLGVPGSPGSLEPVQQGEAITFRWTGQGDPFQIPIEGECGHRWAICLHFHKGQLFMLAVDHSDRGWEGVPAWALQALETDTDEGGESQ